MIEKKRHQGSRRSPVSLGAVNRENLPYPVVYYPNHYGTFFAFAEDESSRPTLCLCSKSAIKNLLRLKEKYPNPPNVNPLRRVTFDSSLFPDIIAKNPLRCKQNPVEDLGFAEGLCHRCNLKTPALRYCHEMYGGEFIQHYGWYLNQAYLRLGILKGLMNFSYLKDICPQEYQNEIESVNKARKDYQEEFNRLMNIVHGPKRNDIGPGERYWSNVKINEAQEMINLRRLASKKERAFTTKIENIVRQEFGFRNVGEGWVSETILFQIVQRIFAEREVLRHFRPDWLEGLELDIFIPSLKIAFEYQGQQHFYPIGIWGGVGGLQDQQYRDKIKAKLCASNGIDLIPITYTEPLNDDYILGILKNRGYYNINNRSLCKSN